MCAFAINKKENLVGGQDTIPSDVYDSVSLESKKKRAKKDEQLNLQ